MAPALHWTEAGSQHLSTTLIELSRTLLITAKLSP